MTNERQRRQSPKKRKNKATVLLRVLLVAFLLFAAIKFIAQQPYLSKYDKKIGELQQKIEEQEKQQKHYEELKKLYETDEYQKQLARERLGLVEENEKVFIDVSGQ